MNDNHIYENKILSWLVSLTIGLFFPAACASSSPTVEIQMDTSPIPSVTQPPPTLTATTTPSTTPTYTLTPTYTITSTLTPSETPTPSPIPTNTETISEMLKTHIVFFLIVPEKGRIDACGEILLEPIISKRYRSGDRVKDAMIALNMLFGVDVKYYGTYYNALWDTDLTINSYVYKEKEDFIAVDFGGFLPVMQLSKCDKHGIREQIWKTFRYYGFKNKVFTIDGKFLIDQLNR